MTDAYSGKIKTQLLKEEVLRYWIGMYGSILARCQDLISLDRDQTGFYGQNLKIRGQGGEEPQRAVI